MSANNSGTTAEIQQGEGYVAPTRFQYLISEIKKNKNLYGLLAPFFILFFVFTILPVVMSLFFSFTYFDMLQPPKFVGWQNYYRLFMDDDVFIIALKNTFLFAVITGPVSYLACFVFAWIVNELPPKLRAVLTLIFFAPSIAGNVLQIFQLIFDGNRYGYINSFLMRWGIIQQPILWTQDVHYMLWVIMLVQLWLALGNGFLVFIAGLQSVDKTLYEAGAMDGIRNRWQELWFITLPIMRPQLLFGAVLQITVSFSVSYVAMAIAGFPSVDYAARTVVSHLVDYGTIRFELGYASAIATILFALMLGSNMMVQKMLRKVGES